MDKSRASGGTKFRRDANLTAFFSKTIPAVVTSHPGKDFKLSCLEVIHTTAVDIRKLIGAPLFTTGPPFAGSLSRRATPWKNGVEEPLPRRRCSTLTADG
ncbi:MAG TPA: hypothetical protein VG432_17375 [Gemmatimonadaceae bacterium]|nr:hypothetical protein [Gemmatimonadaceae bacterium]